MRTIQRSELIDDMMLPGKLSQAGIALFLDVDGTLLEIATTPDGVQVSTALQTTLQQTREHEQGALALISGRSIHDIDRLFAPCVFAAAGQHGVERRDAQGKLIRPDVDRRLLQPARRKLHSLQQIHAGLLIEDKGSSLALHYRLAPQLQPLVEQVMTELQASIAHAYCLRPGKYVLELTPLKFSKGTAIEAFMNEPPFAGRTPVFIGDDLTDEDGFMAVNGLGGYSIRVGPATESAARYDVDDVGAVLHWLQQRNHHLQNEKPDAKQS